MANAMLILHIDLHFFYILDQWIVSLIPLQNLVAPSLENLDLNLLIYTCLPMAKIHAILLVY